MNIANAIFGKEPTKEEINEHNKKVLARRANTNFKTPKKAVKPKRIKKSTTGSLGGQKSFTPLEHDEQVVFVKWLRTNKIFHFSIPNESALSSLNRKTAMIVGVKLKKEGLIKGASDIFVLLPDKILAIEMKRSKKSLSKVSKEQSSFKEEIGKFEYCDSFIAYGAAEAIKIVEQYF